MWYVWFVKSYKGMTINKNRNRVIFFGKLSIWTEPWDTRRVLLDKDSRKNFSIVRWHGPELR